MILYIKKIIIFISYFFKCKNTLKVALQYLFNVVILFKIFFLIFNLILYLKQTQKLVLSKIWKKKFKKLLTNLYLLDLIR